MTKSNKNNPYLTAVIIFVIIINLTFLYYIKYQNQNLSLNEFNLSSFGNLLNLFLAVSLIIGIVILVLKRNVNSNYKSFYIFFILNQISILLIFGSKNTTLPFGNIYLLGQSGDKLLIGSLFTFYAFTYLVMIFLVWLDIIKTKNILIIRAMFNSALSMLFILLFVFLFIIGKESGFKKISITNEKNNIGVVLGAAVWKGNIPSPSLAGRVDKAISLFDQNKISKIFLTGSNAPGEMAESEVAYNYIKAKNINTKEIFIEKETTSTNEQIRYIKNNLLTEKYNVIVISDAYHLVRILEIAKFHNIKIQVAASELSQSFEKALYNKIREALALTVFWFFAI
ncbi:MAG TPA: hypothetical protein DHV28_17850 [Ignavibacteriales bacterium]|nr:hypothetical protein [Ignavibacteriales bacterium]